MKKTITNPTLRTWVSLNEVIVQADEAACKQLLKEELAGRKRKQFVRRIHSRLNRIRAKRERQELDAKL